MAKIVMVEIDSDGNPTVDLDGYKGKGCDAVQKLFGDALGTTTKAVKKPEHNAVVVNKQKLVR
jgi:hypothetical protein